MHSSSHRVFLLPGVLLAGTLGILGGVQPCIAAESCPASLFSVAAIPPRPSNSSPRTSTHDSASEQTRSPCLPAWRTLKEVFPVFGAAGNPVFLSVNRHRRNYCAGGEGWFFETRSFLFLRLRRASFLPAHTTPNPGFNTAKTHGPRSHDSPSARPGGIVHHRTRDRGYECNDQRRTGNLCIH